MTDPPIMFTRPDQTVQMHRTAAAQAGVLAAEQAGARFLCLDLHVAVAGYDRAVAAETAARRDLICHLETLFRHGPRPLSDVGGLGALNPLLDRLQATQDGRQDAEMALTDVAATVACGPRDALRRRHAERQGCTS